MLKAKRLKSKPILSPTQNDWEDFCIFNPAAIKLDGKVHLIYRAMCNKDKISRLGHAVSEDGINFTRENIPMYQGLEGYNKYGVEDPRAVVINNEVFVVYTSISMDLEKLFETPILQQDLLDAYFVINTHIGCFSTKDFVTFKEHTEFMPEVIGKDVTLFPEKINDKYALLFRTGTKETYLTYAEEFGTWGEIYYVFTNGESPWDSFRVGIGAPPIKTDYGWLLFYHGVDHSRVYSLGLMVLDLEDQTKVIYRSKEPILAPQTEWEKTGLVNNVIFTSGVVEMKDDYYIYYGAADKCIGVASISMKEVEEEVKKNGVK